MNTTEIEPALFVKMVRMAWDTQNNDLNRLLEGISDEQLSQETAPGKNTGKYLLGHLAAINDNLFTILGLGERMHPELDEVFLDTPDKSGMQMPGIDQLKTCMNEINARLTEYFDNMEPQQWFQRHMSVSEEDFAKQPHRNKLNVLINRTAHQSYHLGQMAYLKK